MDNLAFGLQVTVLGLGIVFGLLVLLWLLLTVALRFEPEPPADEPTTARLRIRPLDGIEPRLVAAIAVAIARHAEARRGEAAPVMRSYWPGSLLFASRWVAAGRMRQGQSWRRGPR